MNDFAIMSYAASGMDAQRSALDVLAGNVARVQTASPGHPVRPLEPQFAVAGADDLDDGADAEFASLVGNPGASGATSFGDGDAFASGGGAIGDGETTGGAADGEFASGDDDQLPGLVTFAGTTQGRPATGIDAVSEMVAVLGAQRAYEADATVFDTGKRLVERTLDVERS